MKSKHQTQLLLRILAAILTIQLSSAVDFLFNGFPAASSISFYGNATTQSNILTLTQDSSFSIGRALYSSRIPTKHPNTTLVLPFSTSFIFAMAPLENLLPGHGLVFLFVPHEGIEGSSSAQNLGFLNFTNNGNPNNHVLGIEFDCFRNEEFNDINDNHVGVDVNSLISVSAHEAGFWREDDDEETFDDLQLNNGRNYQVWIDYADGVINVTMAPLGITRPRRPLLSVGLNLSEVLQDEMYVGFTASTGTLIQRHNILGWSFSNTNFSLRTPIYRTRGFIAGFSRSKRKRKEKDEMEDWELEYWPHRISYQELESATKGFADENVIGIGTNGKVYRGVLPGGSEVAVKRISHENGEGTRSFLAEMSSLGRVKHRNLVGLRGWCKKDKNSLILVYDYMENGSLDKWVFEEKNSLSYKDRIRILKQVALGILYLHDEWEVKVLHRDIKSSNVLLDREMNARLGDFGLARMHDHDKVAGTTQVVGTVGYLAPEIVKSGRALTQTDVFSYGVLILEVICGRRPIEEGKPPLVSWVWECLRRGELLTVVDPWLRDVDEVEVERVIYLGLLCAHPNPSARPAMRQVVKLFEGKSESEGGDDLDGYLLERMRSNEMMSMHREVFRDGSGLHPTFEEIRGVSSSMSFSWSNSVVGGR
ncbi:L-type lectin-domain containing receptor kinase vii.1 [Phtheirospermum japonicum]|uniref:non-specific serine/threonine protein kinase n=1 Tax=Phtheirospermum japonicum TaxID=374723 RepID=A0A830CDB8_9LAMI|nr:L-type lectin-domain containing receptor kinase vii.1 [Phtheirospermum japonicum]